MKRFLTSFAVLTLALGLRAEVQAYKIDPVHSTVNFTLRHVVSRFTGSFTQVSGTISFDADAPEKSSVEAAVEIGSVNTANETRNGHLLDPDRNFFAVAKYPTSTFKSKSWKKTGENSFDVTGDLTINGVTKEVVLKTTLLGTTPGQGGATVSGWEATTVINKNDFGVTGPTMLGKTLGEEVTLTLGVEASAKKA